MKLSKNQRKAFLIVLFLAVILLLSACSSKKTLKVLLVGDSISEGAGASDPGLKWYKYLSPYFEEKYGYTFDIKNVSMGGNTSIAGYVRLAQEEQNENYDIVIICFGQNDYEEDFDLFYESVVRSVSLKFPNATVFSILESSQKDYTTKIRTIQSICDYYGANTIDTIKGFADSGKTYEELCDDGTHPNDAGHQVYFETARDAIEVCFDTGEFVPRKILQQERALTEKLEKWSEPLVILKDEMKTISELEYEFETIPGYGRIAIDKDMVSGLNKLTIYNGDSEIYSDEKEWNAGFNQEHIECVYLGAYGEKIRVVFSRKEEAEGFHGIMIIPFK